MRLFNEEVYIYETDGMGMTLPREVADLIESLRAVARAADFVTPPKPASDYDSQGVFALREALDALPLWVLEE